jgi:AAA domain/Bifunctional DNA primase/polymerase, N-terminal
MIPSTYHNLADAGLSLIPVQTNKLPLVKWKEWQHTIADEAQLLEWAERLTPSGWAVVTGAISKVFVLDFDGPQGQALLERHGLKPHVQTPKGFHIYYQYPEYSIATGAGVLPGLDVRGDGGYVVAVNGGSYSWLREFTPDDPSTLPDVIKNAIGMAQPVTMEPVLIADTNPVTPFSYEVFLNDALERSRQMGRNQAGFWLATQLRDNGFSEAKAFEIGAEYAGSVDQVDAKGHEAEYKWSEYVASVKSAYAKPAREPWIGNEPLAPTKSVTFADKPTSSSLFSSISRMQDQLKTEGSASMLVDGLLTGEGVHLAAGDSGLGKTPLFYQLALCIASGLPFLGRKTSKGKVLYFDMENSLEGRVNLTNSLIDFLGLTKVQAQDFLVTDSGEFGDIKPAVREHRPALVIIDTLRQFSPEAADNDNLAAGNFIKPLKQMSKEFRCAFIIVHHTRKNTSTVKGEPNRLETAERVLDWMKLASGSRTLINSTDNRLALDVPNPTGTYKGADLLLKGHGKLRGETPLVCVQRVLDREGYGIGYRQMTGSINLLDQGEQRETFIKLPVEFTFQEAKFLYGHSDKTTRKWLARCENFGLIEVMDRGKFRKLV